MPICCPYSWSEFCYVLILQFLRDMNKKTKENKQKVNQMWIYAFLPVNSHSHLYFPSDF